MTNWSDKERHTASDKLTYEAITNKLRKLTYEKTRNHEVAGEKWS